MHLPTIDEMERVSYPNTMAHAIVRQGTKLEWGVAQLTVAAIQARQRHPDHSDLRVSAIEGGWQQVWVNYPDGSAIVTWRYYGHHEGGPWDLRVTDPAGPTGFYVYTLSHLAHTILWDWNTPEVNVWPDANGMI